jgi:hypothetical protein
MNFVFIALAVLVLAVASYFILVNSRETAPVPNSGFTGHVVPNERVHFVVHGWNEHQLSKILIDFHSMYKVAGTISRPSGDILRISFEDGIAPTDLAFLVNYIQYPFEFEVDERVVRSLAVVTLGPEFGIPSPDLDGQRAFIFVPANDKEHDLVHLMIEGVETYRISFTDMKWRTLDDARWRPELDELVRYASTQ